MNREHSTGKILPQIATLGPDPAPIAGDISYEYEDYDYDYDTIQNIQVSHLL